MRKKIKTQEELFLHVLNKWKDDELEILNEWGIGRKDLSRKHLEDRYERYKAMWKELENG